MRLPLRLQSWGATDGADANPRASSGGHSSSDSRGDRPPPALVRASPATPGQPAPSPSVYPGRHRGRCARRELSSARLPGRRLAGRRGRATRPRRDGAGPSKGCASPDAQRGSAPVRARRSTVQALRPRRRARIGRARTRRVERVHREVPRSAVPRPPSNRAFDDGLGTRGGPRDSPLSSSGD